MQKVEITFDKEQLERHISNLVDNNFFEHPPICGLSLEDQLDDFIKDNINGYLSCTLKGN